ncbi:SIR2 family protein [Aeromonas salmonicida]|uniref:P-loop NTPase n=1 Tax=Aeromonas salmonicida TaxID=645 RepID=UPI00259E82EF|nr:SIR2 family protein [Aeromonas salmonicida]MDM5128314.1 SIR2 family protein [Aeromonas salmonicida]
MIISKNLVEKVKRGRTVLFLGAGALFGAKLTNHDVPTGDKLGQLLSERFLSNEYEGYSLAQISELAISEHGIYDVQEYIKDIFEDITPAEFHRKLPEFQWKAIFTTNYDRLIEICYEQASEHKQRLKTILSNEDNLAETSTTNDIINYVKLHGCITRTKDPRLPLILTVEQYNNYENNRENLFKYLYELAIEYSIIFVGHSLQDANIRNIISMVSSNVPQGQRHYLIKPGMKTPEKNLWSSKKIEPIDMTFKDFIYAIDKETAECNKFEFLIRPQSTHKIQKIFNSNISPSEELIRFLTNCAEYIKEDMAYIQSKPDDFYRGSDLGWYPIADSLPINRSISERFFEEVILKPDAERTDKSELILVKAEAGAGKTVFLRQMAWKMKDLGFGCALWINNSEQVNFESLKEIYSKSTERIFLFWDDASLHIQKMNFILKQSIREQLPITIITAERYNEWNSRCESIKDYVSATYILNNLSIREIEDLISKLELHDCLGPNLKSKSRADRLKEFTINFERQLLVALHEATMGEPFEDIIFNEYESIEPIQAKTIYRTICTLNRLRVPVRAGLIARMFNISFDEFKDKFFLPLEKVVLWENTESDDIHYRSRHPEIAEIVFGRSFSTALERYKEYIAIIDKINTSFESDRISFRHLIKAKSLHEIFPNHDDVANIYSYALDVIGEDPYILQQMAIFERIRPSGNLNNAIDLLQSALDKAPYDSSIYHSLATIWRDKANSASDAYTRIKFRGEAKKNIDLSTSKFGLSSYNAATAIELSIDNFKDLLIDNTVSERVIDDYLIKIEELILSAKQKFPEDGFISTLEASLASILDDNKRVMTSLSNAFNENNRDPLIAIRLSKIYIDSKNPEAALKILKDAIERRRSHHRLNFQYAETLRELELADTETLIYYYRRSFTPSDQNYKAQFWFARFAYESNNAKEKQLAKETFFSLQRIRISAEEKNRVRDYTGGEQTPKYCYGCIKSISSNFGIITVDGAGDDVYFPSTEVENELWDVLKIGDRMKFFIGYRYSGPICCKIVPY